MKNINSIFIFVLILFTHFTGFTYAHGSGLSDSENISSHVCFETWSSLEVSQGFQGTFEDYISSYAKPAYEEFEEFRELLAGRKWIARTIDSPYVSQEASQTISFSADGCMAYTQNDIPPLLPPTPVFVFLRPLGDTSNDIYVSLEAAHVVEDLNVQFRGSLPNQFRIQICISGDRADRSSVKKCHDTPGPTNIWRLSYAGPS